MRKVPQAFDDSIRASGLWFVNDKSDQLINDAPYRQRVLTFLAIRAFLRLRLIIQNSLLGSYMPKVPDVKEESIDIGSPGMSSTRTDNKAWHYYWRQHHNCTACLWNVRCDIVFTETNRKWKIYCEHVVQVT